MTHLTDQDRAQIREEARRDYPTDLTMQDIRYVRLLRSRELQDLPFEKRLERWIEPEYEQRATVPRREVAGGN